MLTPITAEIAWPRIAFRGWPSGDRIALYSSTAEAPYHQSATSFTRPPRTTYKRRNQRRRMMRTYTRRIVKHSRHYCQPTKRAHQRPKRPKNIPNILLLLPPIPQKPRHGRRKSMQRRRRKNAIKVPIDIEMPFPASIQNTHSLQEFE